MDIVEKIVALHEVLTARDVPHAFGGALALAWCTQRARGTIDIDINVFLSATMAKSVCTSLPETISWSQRDLDELTATGQVRLFWEQVPIDLFLNTTEFHEGLADRVRWEQFGGEKVPFLGCTDLAIFKGFFNRTRDWVDLEEMLVADSVDLDVVLGVLVRYLGGSDERINRLRKLAVDVSEVHPN